VERSQRLVDVPLCWFPRSDTVSGSLVLLLKSSVSVSLARLPQTLLLLLQFFHSRGVRLHVDSWTDSRCLKLPIGVLRSRFGSVSRTILGVFKVRNRFLNALWNFFSVVVVLVSGGSGGCWESGNVLWRE
jgi:hypothetical protein